MLQEVVVGGGSAGGGEGGRGGGGMLSVREWSGGENSRLRQD